MSQTLHTVICSLNSQYIHSSLAPWYLVAGIREYADTTVTSAVVEGTVNESPDAVLSRIVALQPDVVGFCCYIWNIESVQRLTERLKATCPSVCIVWGGPEVSYRAADCLRNHSAVSYVVGGEGEKPFAQLLLALSHGQAVQGIEGVSYRDGEHIIEAQPYVTDALPPEPYTDACLRQLNGRIAYLESSRGCPFSCAFCLSGRCGTVRFFPLERTYRDIVRLAQSGTKTVKFVDRTFNANRNRARDIIRFICQRYGTDIPRDVCFHFEIGGDLLDEETVTILSEAPAGLFQLEIGIQSFHQPTLDAVCRKTDLDRLCRFVKRLLACQRVHIHIDLIAGLPRETLTIFAESFNAAYALEPHMLQLGFLKLLHGSPMRENPEQYPCTFSENPPYEVMETPWLNRDELVRLHRIETVLDRLYNSGRFRRTLRYLLDVTGWTPFALLEWLSERLPAERMSLDAYTERVFTVCNALEETDTDVLCGVMSCDRIATNPSGILPLCLRRYETQRKQLKRLADSDARFRRPTGVKRGTAFVDGVLVYADYTVPHPVTGEYPLSVFTPACLERNTQWVLFDLDGTLTDPAVGITRSVQYALKHFGIEENDQQRLQSYIGPPLLDTFAGYGLTPEQSREALRVYREYFADIGLYENEVYEGIPELLRDLKRAGYHVVMATSKPEMYACRLMQHFALSYFDCIAGSDMAETRADKVAVIRYALERVGLSDMSTAVMIGDRKYDVEGARLLGMSSIGVLYGYGGREELQTAGADRIAESVSDLRQMLL